MTSPRDSNIRDDDTNNNQRNNMRELIATQNQLNQMTAQFIANSSGEDPTLQKFLEDQTLLMLKVTDQMINMDKCYPKRVWDNRDERNIILDRAPACIICGDKDHTSRNMETNVPIVKRNTQLDNAPPLKLLATYVKETIMFLVNAPSFPWLNKGNEME